MTYSRQRRAPPGHSLVRGGHGPTSATSAPNGPATSVSVTGPPTTARAHTGRDTHSIIGRAIDALPTTSVYGHRASPVGAGLSPTLPTSTRRVPASAVAVAGSLLLLPMAGPAPSGLAAAWGFAVLWGAISTGPIELMPLLYLHRFGPERLGAKLGLASLCNAIPVSTAPTLAGVIFDRTGSYDLAIFACVALYAVSLIPTGCAMGLVRRHRPEAAIVRP